VRRLIKWEYGQPDLIKQSLNITLLSKRFIIFVSSKPKRAILFVALPSAIKTAGRLNNSSF
jgi:hypothetical protein